MQLEPQVTFKNVAPSDLVLDQINASLARLEQRFGCIVTCRVVFARAHHHRRKDERFRVDLVLTLPRGGEVIVNRDAPETGSEDPKIVVREAFDMAGRRLCQQLGDGYRTRVGDAAE
jgi:hypothetical protein